ncbi:CU044_2847 family protein [Streptomyces kebangsaanensis]|uniref:CU044_2847 family protein n=1 Tax=Streptomyces kebangsaanensis TaxID=864058 RepID=A0ABW6KM95_9ACTN
MTDFAVRDKTEVLVDFPVRQGVKQVALTPADVAQRSGEAIDSAMATIRNMAEKLADAVNDLARRPDEMEVEFGLTFDAQAGALIAKAGVEAALTVRLSWSAGTPT